jgi:hypothetical protein
LKEQIFDFYIIIYIVKLINRHSMLDVLVDEEVHSAENTRKENTQMARDLSAFELLVLYLERDERRAIIKKWQESL